MHLENMLHIQLFKTTFLTLMYLTSILSQSLYDNDFQQCHTFNRESRERSVEDLINVTETILKERTLKLEKCNARHNSIVHAYSELLRMNNKGIIPNGKFLNIQNFSHQMNSIIFIHFYYFTTIHIVSYFLKQE